MGYLSSVGKGGDYMFKIPLPMLEVAVNEMTHSRVTKTDEEVLCNYGYTLMEFVFDKFPDADIRDIITILHLSALQCMDRLVTEQIESLPDNDPVKKSLEKELAMLNLIVPCGEEQ